MSFRKDVYRISRKQAMLGKNIIITDIIDSALFIPIECIHTQDSISYVVAGGKRKQVIIGKSNENEIIIKAGLKEDEDIYLLPPEGYADFKLSRLPSEIIAKYAPPKKEPKQAKEDIDTNKSKPPPPSQKEVRKGKRNKKKSS